MSNEPHYPNGSDDLENSSKYCSDTSSERCSDTSSEIYYDTCSDTSSETCSDTCSDTCSETSSYNSHCKHRHKSCRCALNCNTQTPEEIKYQTLKHSSNYIGISKRMAYGQYIRTTPGMETFASKKIPVLQPLVNRNIKCFSSYWCKHL